MTRFLGSLTLAGTIGLVGAAAAETPQAGKPLASAPKSSALQPAGSAIHIKPTTALAGQLQAQKPSGGATVTNLTYHNGPIMVTPTLYKIFWQPAKMQDGSNTTPFTALEQIRIRQMVGLYPHHALNVVNTQYYQKNSNNTITYISGDGADAGYIFDTNPFPAKGCTDSYSTQTQNNCLTNTQLLNEIDRVRQQQGLPTGLNMLYLIFTPNGMGSCFDSSGSSCAYTQYCAYHSYYTIGGQYVIFGNEPFGDRNVCLGDQTSPNNDPELDAILTAASHEISEAITDPLLNAWYDDSTGEENGDKCAYNYGNLSWDAGKANQMWSGVFFKLQQEWSNHYARCVAEPR